MLSDNHLWGEIVHKCQGNVQYVITMHSFHHFLYVTHLFSPSGIHFTKPFFNDKGQKSVKNLLITNQRISVAYNKNCHLSLMKSFVKWVPGQSFSLCACHAFSAWHRFEDMTPPLLKKISLRDHVNENECFNQSALTLT